jgi:rod shape determining protein RodA
MRQLTYTQKLAHFHWAGLVLMLAMATAGVFFIYSATFNSDYMAYPRQQVVWLIVGSGVFLCCALFDYRWLVRWGLPIFLVSLVVLLATPFVSSETKGARSWIRFAGFTVQPGEFSKIAFLCGYTWFLVTNREHVKKFWFFLLAGFVAAIPVGLILLQPDFGSAAVFGPTVFFMMMAAGVRKRYLAVPILLVAAGLWFAYFVVYRVQWNGTGGDIPRAFGEGFVECVSMKWVVDPPVSREKAKPAPKPAGADPAVLEKMEKIHYLVKPYQLDRIRVFFNPNLDPKGAGWTINQSLIAVGSGGMKGKGFLKGDQNQYGFLPEDVSYNDLIFPVIAEEFGFWGGTLVILGEGFLILIALKAARRARDLPGALLATGFAGILFAHFFENVGMTIKVMPITGIPLPLISYGGSFLVSCMAGLGIVQSVWIHRKDYSTA